MENISGEKLSHNPNPILKIKELLQLEESRPYREINKIVWRLPDKTVHRVNGPAIEYECGDKQWWVNGLLHRENGPAIEYYDGSYEWYLNGKKHRTGGPAVYYRLNNETQWWVNGKQFVIEEKRSLILRLMLKFVPKVNSNIFKRD